MKDLYIIGAGGFGREAADIVHAINERAPTYRIAGFIDDDASLWGSVKNDIPVRGGREYLKQLPAARAIRAVVAIADARIKESFAESLRGLVTWENLVHPTAIVSKYSDMGCGNIVQAHAFISSNTRMGNHCAISSKSAFGHDAEMGDYVSVMRYCDITGYVVLEKGAYLGTSVSIIPGVRVGAYAYVCAGSVVFGDVKANAVVIGNPARQVKWKNRQAPAVEIPQPRTEAPERRLIEEMASLLETEVSELSADTDFRDRRYAWNASKSYAALLMLENAFGRSPDFEAFSGMRTIGDLLAFVRENA
jgi:sugar O-acyltransferase (sialic acid O-acetyltransferase NeuD family)